MQLTWTRATSVLTASLLLGCGELKPVEPYSPTTDPADLFMALTLDHGAVNLAMAAPYNQLQLTATPRDALGTPMSGLPGATFRSSDTTRVFVTPGGLLQARRGATAVQVIAEVAASGNVRHADTVLVNVSTSTAPRMLETLSIEPTPEGAVWGMLMGSGLIGQLLFQLSGNPLAPRLTVRTLDASGVAIPGLVVEYQSLNPDVVTLHPRFGNIGMLQPGEADLVVRTTAYGVSKADTTRVTVTPPVMHGVVINPGLNGGPPTVAPRNLTIRPGGYVVWTNMTKDSLTVTFEDPASAGQIAELCEAFGEDHPAFCESGNIRPFMTATNVFYEHTRGRQFLEPGVYPYRIEPLGVTGRITVADELP